MQNFKIYFSKIRGQNNWHHGQKRYGSWFKQLNISPGPIASFTFFWGKWNDWGGMLVIMHLSIVWRTLRPPGKVRLGCVMSWENMTQGCVKVQLWSVKVTEIGASMSIVLVVKLVHTPIVCQNGPSKILILVRQTHPMVRHFYDAGGASWPWMSDAHNGHWCTFPGGRRVRLTIDKRISYPASIIMHVTMFCIH